MSKKYPVRPVVPTYGVTPDFTQDPYVFSVIDDGSRGWPWAVIFVPCIEVSGKAQVVIDSSIVPQDKRGPLFTTAHWMPQSETMTPYTLNVALKDWPSHGEFVVLLLLPFQSNGVGSEPHHPFSGTTTSEYWNTVTREVNNYLSQTSFGSLALGRIEQRKKPPSRPVDPVAPGGPNPIGRTPSRPKPPTASLTFALASCQFPSDILDQMPLDDVVTPGRATPGPADASLLALGEQLSAKIPLTLILLMGDQVYVDATAGLFDPKVLDEKYRWPYQRRGASRGQLAVRASLNLTVFGLIDDHEIDDNWDQGAVTVPGQEHAIDLGKRGYWEFQRGLKHGESLPADCWRAETHDGFSFFLADTRTERDTRTASNINTRSIMSTAQFKALTDWLVAQNPNSPKFIATSSALLPRHLSVMHDPATALHTDSWDAYPRSLHELLAYICDNEIKGLVFLSGDQHISNVVQANVSNAKTGKSCDFHSVHSSALYAPYPFANAVPEDFARFETFPFSFRKDTQYQCKVESAFAPPGDGFAVLSVKPSSVSGGSVAWQLEVTFHDETGPKPEQPLHYKIL